MIAVSNPRNLELRKVSAIKPTQDMVQRVYARINFVDHDDSGIAEGLAEVFDLIEETHKASRYCGDKLMTGVTCRLTEDEPHFKHRASMNGQRIEWT